MPKKLTDDDVDRIRKLLTALQLKKCSPHQMLDANLLPGWWVGLIVLDPNGAGGGLAIGKRHAEITWAVPPVRDFTGWDALLFLREHWSPQAVAAIKALEEQHGSQENTEEESAPAQVETVR